MATSGSSSTSTPTRVHSSMTRRLVLVTAFALVSNPIISAYTITTAPLSKIPSLSRSGITPDHPHNNNKFSWIIIGGGIHGVHIAAQLIEQQQAGRGIRIIDDGPELLHQWKTRTKSTGMRYLRSSVGHHLDMDENDLRKFAGVVMTTDNNNNNNNIVDDKKKNNKGKRRRNKKKSNTNNNNNKKNEHVTSDYNRPSLEMFNLHCDSVINKHNLEDAHIRGRVTCIHPTDESVTITVQEHIDDGDGGMECCEYTADHVVLALGNDKPIYPDWVTPNVLKRGVVRHLLDANTTPKTQHHHDQQQPSSPSRRTAIIGGGITAAHKAIELVKQQTNNDHSNQVHLISRNSIIERQFDTHQDWMMSQASATRSKMVGGLGCPQCQLDFAALSSLEQRRNWIQKERIAGTITAALNRGKDGLRYMIQRREVLFHQGEVLAIHTNPDDQSSSSMEEEKDEDGVTLTLSTGERIRVDEILLATGFGKSPPGGGLVKNLVEHENLPVSQFCGYPAIGSDLRWHSRIFVAGALAELELGPSARNIAGARLAAERIVEAAVSTGAGVEHLK